MPVSNPQSDQELLSLFRDGAEGAFDQLFSRFYSPLCYFADNILKDKHAAEDIVQDMLLKVWQRQQDFEQPGALRSFLYTGVKNACFNQLDKLKVKARHEEYSMANPNREADILHLLIRAEVVRQLYSVMDTLPEQCRNVIRMTFEEGRKPKEIADELGITISTVNNHKMRGLKLLKDRLTDQDFGIAMTLLGIILVQR
jgi:RNA polymerase sigma-70 factor (family 1)